MPFWRNVFEAILSWTRRCAANPSKALVNKRMDEEKVKSAISDSDKKKIEDKCDECIKWLDANQMAEKDEYEDKQKEVEAVCNPIIQNLYSGAGGTFTFDQNENRT